jgi:hypothetical protein
MNATLGSIAHHRSPVVGFAGVILVFTLIALAVVELFVAIYNQTKKRDVYDPSPESQSCPTDGRWSLFVSGTGLRHFRRRAIVVGVVFGLITVVGYLAS